MTATPNPKPPPDMTVTHHGKPSPALLVDALYEVIVKPKSDKQKPAA